MTIAKESRYMIDWETENSSAWLMGRRRNVIRRLTTKLAAHLLSLLRSVFCSTGRDSCIIPKVGGKGQVEWFALCHCELSCRDFGRPRYCSGRPRRMPRAEPKGGTEDNDNYRARMTSWFVHAFLMCMRGEPSVYGKVSPDSGSMVDSSLPASAKRRHTIRESAQCHSA